MQDGLGLVYEKQGNTGAAAYGNPIPLNPNPLGQVTQNLNNEYNIRLHDKLIRDRQKERDLADLYNQKFDINAWHQRNQMELGADAMAVKQRLAQLKSSQVDPRDYNNPKSKEYQDLTFGLQNKANTVKRLESDYISLRDKIIQDANTQNPQFDTEKSLKALDNWMMLPTINDSAKIDPGTLLVQKPKQFSTYQPLSNFKIAPYVGSFGKDTPTGGASGTTLNKKNLRSDIEALANDPINQEHFDWGVKQGLWKDRKEYADVLYDKADNLYTADYKTTIKAPKDDGGSGLSEDQVNEIVNTPPTVMKIADLDIDGKTRQRDGSTVYTSASVLYPQSVGNLNLSIPSAAAFNIDTGKKGTNATVYKLTDGTLGVALKYKDGRGFIGDINPGENETVYQFKDKSGNKIQLTKDEAIKQGYIEYVPVIIGNGTYKDPADPETKTSPQPIVVEADQYINKVNGKSSQALNDAYNKLYVQKQLADKLNGTSQASTKANQNKVVPRSKIKSLVGTKGYEGYTEQELVDYYKSQGYSIE